MIYFYIHPLEMSDAIQMLMTLNNAAHALTEWGESTAEFMTSIEAHIAALTESSALEEMEVLYKSARGEDDIDDTRSSGLLQTKRIPSLIYTARRNVATTLYKRNKAETLVAEAKSKALVALEKANLIIQEANIRSPSEG